MKRLFVLVCMLGSGVCFGADAQPSALTIDLANLPNKTVVAPGAYKVRLVNRLVGVPYQVDTSIRTSRIAQPFDVKVLQLGKAAFPTCEEDVNDLKKKLLALTCERDVAQLRLTYVNDLPSCNATQRAEFGLWLEAATQWEGPPLPTLTEGDTLTASVKRSKVGSESDERRCGNKASQQAGLLREMGDWVFQAGEEQAQWLTFYGFNFADSGNEDFFSKANAGSDPATFTITKKADRDDNAFSPSVYFMRLPGGDDDQWYSWRTDDSFGGITAGLGFDLDNPTVFLGYGWGWGYNIMLTSGVIMHKENRLNGQYHAGDVVAENLTADQLADSTYKPRLYVGVAFRFGSNPFPAKQTAAPTPQPAPAPAPPSQEVPPEPEAGDGDDQPDDGNEGSEETPSAPVEEGETSESDAITAPPAEG